MTPEARQRRLQSLVREARGRTVRLADELERRKDLPAVPGDLFVLPATAELPVEWAILDRNPGSGELLAVPVDYHPLTGSADVAAEPEGSLVLRCRFGVWLPPALFKAELRTGVLADEIVTAARHRWRQLEQGEVTASPLAEEIDVDPEYRDWIRDVPERARGLAANWRRRSREASPFPHLAQALAAAFALLAIGLSVWVIRLQQEVEQLSTPELGVPTKELPLGVVVRGETKLSVPPGARHLSLILVVDESVGSGERYLEITDHKGALVWRSRRVALEVHRETRLDIPRRLLPDGLYRVRVYPESGFDSPPLAEQVLWVETLEPGGDG
jgi:hypothetical protein